MTNEQPPKNIKSKSGEGIFESEQQRQEFEEGILDVTQKSKELSQNEQVNNFEEAARWERKKEVIAKESVDYLSEWGTEELRGEERSAAVVVGLENIASAGESNKNVRKKIETRFSETETKSEEEIAGFWKEVDEQSNMWREWLDDGDENKHIHIKEHLTTYAKQKKYSPETIDLLSEDNMLDQIVSSRDSRTDGRDIFDLIRKSEKLSSSKVYLGGLSLEEKKARVKKWLKNINTEDYILEDLENMDESEIVLIDSREKILELLENYKLKEHMKRIDIKQYRTELAEILRSKNYSTEAAEDIVERSNISDEELNSLRQGVTTEQIINDKMLLGAELRKKYANHGVPFSIHEYRENLAKKITGQGFSEEEAASIVSERGISDQQLESLRQHKNIEEIAKEGLLLNEKQYRTRIAQELEAYGYSRPVATLLTHSANVSKEELDKLKSEKSMTQVLSERRFSNPEMSLPEAVSAEEVNQWQEWEAENFSHKQLHKKFIEYAIENNSNPETISLLRGISNDDFIALTGAPHTNGEGVFEYIRELDKVRNSDLYENSLNIEEYRGRIVRKMEARHYSKDKINEVTSIDKNNIELLRKNEQNIESFLDDLEDNPDHPNFKTKAVITYEVVTEPKERFSDIDMLREMVGGFVSSKNIFFENVRDPNTGRFKNVLKIINEDGLENAKQFYNYIGNWTDAEVRALPKELADKVVEIKKGIEVLTQPDRNITKTFVNGIEGGKEKNLFIQQWLGSQIITVSGELQNVTEKIDRRGPRTAGEHLEYAAKKAQGLDTPEYPDALEPQKTDESNYDYGQRRKKFNKETTQLLQKEKGMKIQLKNHQGNYAMYDNDNSILGTAGKRYIGEPLNNLRWAVVSGWKGFVAKTAVLAILAPLAGLGWLNGKLRKAWGIEGKNFWGGVFGAKLPSGLANFVNIK